jgi:hypothetical protein
VKPSTESIVADLRDLAMFVGLNDKQGASLIRTAADRLEELEQVVGKLREIGKQIAEQDNRITDQPIFIVQQKKIDTGYDPAFTDDIAWIHCDGFMADADEAKKLEDAYNKTGDEPEEWTRTGYIERWEFVTACFTEQGCKDYIDADGHNLKEPRIYADGSYRNTEFRELRNLMLSLYREAAITAQEAK